MKKIISITLLAIILASCSTANIFNQGPFQKRKYNKGYFFNSKNNNLSNKEKPKSTNIVTIKSLISASNEIRDNHNIDLTSITDTIKVTLKDGSIYTGVKIEDTETGIVVLTESGRSVFLLKRDIEELTVTSGLKTLGTEQTKDEYVNSDADLNQLKYETKSGKTITGVSKGSTKHEYHIRTSQGDDVSIPKRKIIDISSHDGGSTSLNRSSLAGLIMFWVGLFTIWIAIGILFLILGYALSKHGFKKTENDPSKYNYRKAKRITKLYKVLFGIIGSIFVFLFWVINLL